MKTSSSVTGTFSMNITGIKVCVEIRAFICGVCTIFSHWRSSLKVNLCMLILPDKKTERQNKGLEVREDDECMITV